MGRLCKAQLLACSALIASPLAAQETGSDGALVDRAGDPDGNVILVTAQKRAQSVQDVPIAIAVLSSEALDRANINDISAISLVVPSVSGAANSSAQPLIAIRGIASNDFTIGADPALGVYIDDVYTGRSAGALGELVDIERIEVVKGPQGTLFGRNTTSGAISIVTPSPNLNATSGQVRAAYGNYNQIEGALILNTPLSDAFAIRGSAIYRTRDGMFRNVVGDRSVDEIDRLAGRLALRWQPSDAVNFVLTGDVERDREDPTIPRSLTIPIPGDANFGGVDGPVALNAPLRNDRDRYGVTLRAEFELGDYSLTSISALRGYTLRYLEDTDASPLTQVHFRLREEQDAISQEIRLNSPDRGPVRWFLGASVYQEDVSALSSAIYDEDAICTGLAGAPSLLPCDTLFRLTPSPVDGLSLFELLSAVAGISDPYVGAAGLVETNRAVGDYFSWGVYGDVTVSLTDQLEVVAGARYSRDRKRVRLLAAPTDSIIALVNGGNVFLRAGQQRASETWGQFQPRFVLNYKPTADLLVYASYTKGYKAGGFNVLQPGDQAFDPEKISNYEMGSKGSIFGGDLQFDLAAFHWIYSDLQVQVFEGGLPLIANAGRARAYGVEGSLSAALGPNLRLSAAASYLDAKYTEFSPAPGVDYSGNRLAFAPEFSGRVGLDYSTVSASGNELSFGSAYSYQSRSFFSPDNGLLTQPGYGLLSARAAYRLASPDLEFAVIGENLTDERFATSGQAIGAINLAQLRIGQPRLVTAQITLRF